MKNITLQDCLNRANLTQHRHNGLILFDYNKSVTFNFDWDEITIQARGIVFEESTGKMVARPLRKFFNYEELTGDRAKLLPVEFQPNLTGPYMVLEKLDGCVHYYTRVMLPDGSHEYMGKIINDPTITHVMGYDHITNSFVPTKIINRFRNGIKNNWVRLTTSHNWSTKSGGKGLCNVIRITDNHKMFTNRGYLPITELQSNDIIYSKEIVFSELQYQFIIGTLLGDSSISLNGNSSAVLQGFHTHKHLEYVNLKKHILGDLSSSLKFTRMSGYGSEMLPYSSTYTHELKRLRQEWYGDSNIKEIPQDIILSDLSFAIWYMDDGSLSNKNKETNLHSSITLHTNGFSYESCVTLVNAIKTLFGDLPITIGDYKGYTICINNGYNNRNATSVIWERISKYFPICMQYKLPSEYQTNLPSCLHDIEFKSQVVLHEEKIIDISYDISHDSKLNSSKLAYDIETETHNYFVHGILVHNSCGISFHYNDRWYVNTRGSFASDQAVWATNWFNQNVRHDLMNKDYTYVFEIIYPENRIVVDYGDKEAMVLISVIDTQGGDEFFYDFLKSEADKIGVDVAKVFHFEKFSDLFTARNGLTIDEEGFVVTFENGYKFKLKGEEYCRVHRTMCNLTPLNFWRAIDINTFKVPQDFLALLPEEFRELTDSLTHITEEIHQNYYNDIVSIAGTVPHFDSSAEGKKARYFWLSTNIDKKMVSVVLDYLNGKDMGVRTWIHSELRPTSNSFTGIELPERLKRILTES